MDFINAFLPNPFRFEKFWLEHKDFKGLVHQWWQELDFIGGTRMYNFQQKIKTLKAKILTWNKEDFGNIFSDKKRLIQDIDLLQKKGMDLGWDVGMKEKEK